MTTHIEYTLSDIVAEMRPRLRRVCPHLADDAFNALIERMASIKLFYEDRPARDARGHGSVDVV